MADTPDPDAARAIACGSDCLPEDHSPRCHNRTGRIIDALRAARAEGAKAEREAWEKRINTPMTTKFLEAVPNEAAHQRQRWGLEHDRKKDPADWFWTLGFLAGKALHDVRGKRAHHIVAAGALLLNWLESEERTRDQREAVDAD